MQVRRLNHPRMRGDDAGVTGNDQEDSVMHHMRQKRAYRRWGPLAALLLGSALLGGVLGTGTVLHGRPIVPPRVASRFNTWTWLPGGRALWISRRPPCSVETTTKACEGGQGTGVRLVYYSPEVRRVEVTLPIARR